MRITMELDKLVEGFCSWLETAGEIQRENELLHKELKNAHKRNKFDQEAAQANCEEINQLRATVDKLHKILTKRFDLEDENAQVKDELLNTRASAAKLEDVHCHQMAEAMESIQTISEAHKAELDSVQSEAQQKLRHELEGKDREIQDKVTEIKTLQREKAEQERARHTDIIKLRLEYDAKMLKLQKQHNTRTQSAQSASTSNEIFRKKLQHVKYESERELSCLKRKVEDLERQLKSRGSKRTKFM